MGTDTSLEECSWLLPVSCPILDIVPVLGAPRPLASPSLVQSDPPRTLLAYSHSPSSRSATLSGAGYFFFGTSATPAEQGRLVETKVKQAGAVAEAATGLKRGQADYERVYQKIADILDVEGYDDGSYGPVLVRLAVRPRFVSSTSSCSLRNCDSALRRLLILLSAASVPSLPFSLLPDLVDAVARLGHVRQGHEDRRIQLCHHALRA